MLPRLEIPDRWRPPPDGEAGSCQWEEEDTPREPRELAGSLPASPSARKTKSRAARTARGYVRTNSLRDAKVLLVSDLHRSESMMDPSLFQYHQHFESPWQLVGKTSLSEVFRVRHRASGELFAVKRSRRRFRSKLQRERCLREIRAVAALPTHPNIVNQYRAWQEGGHFYIQMDYCEGGSLAQWAHKACKQGACMPDEQLWAIACQAAQGLAFLHSHGVMHLDIKPDNIYLSAAAPTPGPGLSPSPAPTAGAGAAGCSGGCSSHGGDGGGLTCRIGDFGLAVAREQGASMDWEEGDGDYVAPELLALGGEPSPAADIFSLGATLFECATGQRLPRSEGWAEADAAALQVGSRPPAFVALLRAMLQPSPGLRPTAQQVIQAVAREQPLVAAAAQAAVDVAAEVARAEEAAAEAALAARQAAAAAAQQQQREREQQAGLPPSPFMAAACLQGGGRSPEGGAPDAASPGAAAGAGAEQFSFDVPPQGGTPSGCGFTFTPGQPLRPHNRRVGGVGPPGSATKGARGTPGAGGRSRMGHHHARWAPALSPLISEGALTPGAAAGLAGLTPGGPRSSADAGGGGGCEGREGAPTPQFFARLCDDASSGDGDGSGGRAPGSGSDGVTPLDLWRPAPLQLPPQTVPMAILSSGGSAGWMSGSGSGLAHGSGGTHDSREGGWRLSRRDIVSPDSDFFNGSHSESDYSYSCGTGRTTSDMEFADALSPMSAELGFFGCGAAGGTRGHTPTSGTPESLRRESCTPGSGPGLPSQQLQRLSPPLEDAQQQQQEQQHGEGGAPAAAEAHAGLPVFQAGPSLAWELHTSPEFLMQLPPGSPGGSLSRSSSLDDAASLPSRALSIRRFPTLDSWGSQLDGAAGGKPPAGPARMDSLASLAAQRLTNTFGQPQLQGPVGQGHEQAAAASAELSLEQAAAAAVAAADGGAPGGGVPLPPGRALRKRQHSSRRTLMAALSRDNSVASSIDGMAPLGKARHIMELESGCSSPVDRAALVHRGDGGRDGGGELPGQQLGAMRRSASMLGREAASASLADAATKALAAVAAAGAGAAPGGGVGGHDLGAAVAPSPLPLSPPTDPCAAGTPPPNHLLLRSGSCAFGAAGMEAAGAAAGLAGQQGPPFSPLHARMTGLKLRGTD